MFFIRLLILFYCFKQIDQFLLENYPKQRQMILEVLTDSTQEALQFLNESFESTLLKQDKPITHRPINQEINELLSHRQLFENRSKEKVLPILSRF